MKDKITLRKIIVYCTTALLFILIASYLITNTNKIFEYIKHIFIVIEPFIYGAAIAYVLTPLYNSIKKLLKKNKIIKHERYIALALTEIIFISSIVITCLIILPQSINSLIDIFKNLPSALEKFQIYIDTQLNSHSWIKSYLGKDFNSIVKSVSDFLEKSESLPGQTDLINETIDSITIFSGVLVNTFIGIIISIFILANKHILRKQFTKIIYAVFGKNVARYIIDEIKVANKMFSGFLFGKTIDSLIVGFVCLLFTIAFDIKYYILISVIVAITNMAPVVGPVIGAIPCIIIILSNNPIQAIYFAIFILVLQQIDGHIIGPKCIGNSTGLSTLWVLFAIILFGRLLDIVGVVIGVPLFAVCYDIVKKSVNLLLEKRKINIEYELENEIEES